MMRFILATLGAVAALGLSGCGDCRLFATCPAIENSAVVLNIRATDGSSVTGVTIVTAGGDQTTCNDVDGYYTSCAIFGGPKTYTLTIRAPGYRTETRTVEVLPDNDLCACINMKSVTIDIQLVKET
ncbi:MAG: hypothetical protein QM765_04655 [Myxococcales bacterium]